MAKKRDVDVPDPISEEERQRNIALADARRAAAEAPAKSGLPQWAYIVIGVGAMAILGVAAYFLAK